MRTQGPQAWCFATTGPTCPRAAAQLVRLFERSRASIAKLAQISDGSDECMSRAGRSRASVESAVSSSSGVASRSCCSDASMHPSEAARAGALRRDLAANRRPCAAASREHAWSYSSFAGSRGSSATVARLASRRAGANGVDRAAAASPSQCALAECVVVPMGATVRLGEPWAHGATASTHARAPSASERGRTPWRRAAPRYARQR